MNGQPLTLQLPGIHFDPEATMLARALDSGQVLEVQWKRGQIQAIRPRNGATHPTENALPWLAPSLLDLQVNGYGGVDFQRRDHLDADRLRHAANTLRQDGCSRFFLTLITDHWESLLDKVRRWKALVDADPELKRAVLGWHLEGPFLSSEPGYVGAHSPHCLEIPTPDHLRKLKAITQNDPLLLTLAPEIPGTEEAIHEARRLGMKVSFGHTNASREALQRGIQAGGEGFTHLGNACPQLLDRHDNILWRVLDHGGLMTGVIPDGIHVSPALFRIIHRLIPDSKIWWTTDAMSAAGAGEGRFTLGDIELVVGKDGVVRHPTTGGFAGSSLRPIEGIQRGAAMLGISWRQAWPYFSSNPSAWMNLETQSTRDQQFVLIQEA